MHGQEEKGPRTWNVVGNKSPLQFSGLCSTSFLSYLSKRLTQLHRVFFAMKALNSLKEIKYTSMNTSPNVLERLN